MRKPDLQSGYATAVLYQFKTNLMTSNWQNLDIKLIKISSLKF